MPSDEFALRPPSAASPARRARCRPPEAPPDLPNNHRATSGGAAFQPRPNAFPTHFLERNRTKRETKQPADKTVRQFRLFQTIVEKTTQTPPSKTRHSSARLAQRARPTKYEFRQEVILDSFCGHSVSQPAPGKTNRTNGDKREGRGGGGQLRLARWLRWRSVGLDCNRKSRWGGLAGAVTEEIGGTGVSFLSD